MVLRDVMYALIAVTVTIVSFVIAAPIFYTMLIEFDTLSYPTANAQNFWSNAYDALFYGFMGLAIVAVIAIGLWLFLRVRRRDYVVEARFV